MKKSGLWTEVALLTAVLGGSAFALRSLSTPYLYVSGLWVLFFALMIFWSAPQHRWIWFNLAFIALVFGGIEAYMWGWDVHEARPRSRMNTPDDVLGYAPVPGTFRHSRWTVAGGSIFETTYTIGEDGLRVSPLAAEDLACIAFFGGSFAFGSGLADHETLAYQVGLKVADRFRVYNFGYRGYGPHQMLAALERGNVENTLDCDLRYVFYSAIASHGARVAEASPWDSHGPHYELVDGDLVYLGHFDDEPAPVQSGQTGVLEEALLRGRAQLEKSLFVSSILTRFGPDSRAEVDAPLFGAVVAEAARIVAERYPTSEFHVLFWDRFRGERESAERVALAEHGLAVQLVSDMLPDLVEDHERYMLGRGDPHPNALANRLIAEYVVEEIIEP